MAKASKREMVWLQCKECSNLNYRTQVHTGQGMGGHTAIEVDERRLLVPHRVDGIDVPGGYGRPEVTSAAQAMDGVLFVIQHRKYPRAVSMRAKGMVDNVGGSVLGVVLNNINISRDYSYYYYQYHYYAYPQDAGKTGRPLARRTVSWTARSCSGGKSLFFSPRIILARSMRSSS